MKRPEITKLAASVMGLFLMSPAFAAVNVPLTIQEALYPGSMLGLDRTADPVTVGIPLPDDPVNGLSDVNQLTLSGASVGQFRVLGRWPSGRIKWVLVDTQANVSAGQKNTSIVLTGGGSGNFGGSPLATDNGATITVSTGTATFTIKKAHFNVIDTAVVGSTTVVASGASSGLVLTGPAPGQTTCPPCTTVYSSANDPNSTAVIEENGPARAVVLASGSHMDSAGNAYLHFSVRIYFYRGKNYVKITSVLRNADYGASNSFATAYKGHQGYELRISPSLSGTANYSFGTDTTTPSTGTLSSTDSAYLYQGESQSMKWQDWCGFGCVPYTTDTGYQIVKNGTKVISGTDTQYPQGWADVSGSNGVGVSIGVYQMSAYWPKSLEFNAGGSDVRIGIWARENSQPYYQVWPQWSVHDLFVNFHASTPAAPGNDFLKFQHYLLARAPIAQYNNAAVFPYPLVDQSSEDTFYTTTASSASPTISPSKGCCIQDFGTSNAANWPLSIYRFYTWHATGGANQTEFRWAYLMNFLTRGMTGRFLNAAHFYRFQTESAWPHSDGFNWLDHPTEQDGFGFPKATSLNSTKGFQDWLDQEHGHWYGMPDFYFMTGDETTHDALLDGPKDWFLTKNSYQNGVSGGLYNSRSIGVELIGATRFSNFLAATGDSDAAAVQQQAVNDYGVQVKPELCVSGYPAGCTLGPADGGPWKTQGVSRTRGIPWGSAGTSGTWCGVSHAYRVNSSFQPAILIQGLLELRNAMGPNWSEYYNSLDLAYGIARWNLSENFVDDGSGRWDTNGFRFGLAMDVPNSCTNAGETPEPDFQPTPTQTTAMTFLAKYLVDGTTDWATKFKINVQKDMVALGITTSDFGEYQVASIINILNNPGSTTLNSVALSKVTDNGGGSYTISWVVPAGTQSYRIKWGAKQIVDWVGFDPTKNVFTGNPATTMPWFAATNVPTLPAPAAAGSTQSLTISTGTTGLSAANFSVKAYVSGSGTSASTPAKLTMVSGSGQTGIGGAFLASPFVVQVTDASGNPVSGVTVSFAVTAGGGTLSATQVISDGSGYASATLLLGALSGANTVTATSGTLSGSPVTFTATATAGATASKLVIVSGNGQTGTTGKALPSPFTVKVTDASGNPVSGVAVGFAVTAGGGSLSAAQATSDSTGQASSTLTLGTTAGTNTVTASSGTLSGSPITFTATGAAPAAAAKLVLVSGNTQSGTTGLALGSPLTVKVTDASGNPVSGVTVTFAVTAGAGTLSATQVVSDSSGLASAVLTLGTAAGTNTVTATSGTLSGSPITFTATATAAAAGSGTTTVTWTRQPVTSGWPGYNGWLNLYYDSVAQQTILYGVVKGSSSIYSTDLFAYAAGTNTWTHISGTGSTTDACPADTATQPGNRHPVMQMAIDTKRNFFWLFGGVCQGNNRQDTYYLQLQADPTKDAWHQVTPAHIPTANSSSAMAYDPDDDVLFVFGSDTGSQTTDNWVYCRTTENPTPGVLTAKQSAAGCALPDDWTMVNPVGGNQPPGVAFSGMVYDPVTKKIIQFGGMTGGYVSQNQTWAYDVPTQTWTRKALSSTAPPVYSGSNVATPAMAYNPATHMVLYHQTSNTGAPADWQYDPVADTWTKLTSTGGGAAIDAYMTYDASRNMLITFSRNTSTGAPDVWQGVLSSPTGTSSQPTSSATCDLNTDGTVNVLDVQLGIRQALGLATCGTADLNGDGICDSTDVQRIITATLGGACVIGK